MKNIIKNNLHFIIFTFLIFILSYFFICTEEDLLYVVSNNFRGFDEFFRFSKGFILSSSLISTIVKIKSIRVIFCTLLIMSFGYIVNKIINIENKSMFVLGLYSLILFPISIFKICTNSFYVVNYLLPITFSLIYINFLVKNNLQNIRPYICFILGYIVSLINPIFTILFLIIPLLVLIYKIKNKENTRNHLTLFLGSITGCASVMYGYHFSNTYVYIPNIVNQIFHKVIPLLYINNLFSFIFIIVVLLLSINIIKFKGKKLKNITLLCDFIIILYLVGHFVNFHYYILYILYILFTISSIVILLNFNNSYMFKRKIKLYYIFKILYILILLSQNSIDETSLSFIYVIDALIILDVLNFIYPKNYLYLTYSIACISTFMLLIAIYANTFYKNIYVKDQIKRELLCNNYLIKLDEKYKKTYPYNIVPSDDYKQYYLKYNNINSKDYFIIE